ncbi:MAG: hypothetical protein KME08_01750 [Aphanothece sp. CMT-3BRIN-NPC111]|jgi:hypothetical protein|nr:hypothetical protein [Aphanothece sp. CMT-3BRIN-NPC111]
MLMTRIHKFLTAPTPNTSSPKIKFWFSLSLTFAVIFGLMGLQKAFSSEYVVQDDARQHVFWMLRFLDPKLFPNDLIADYFQSVAPSGYTALYGAMASVGINPLFLNKLLPMVLALITTAYCFGISMQMLPVPTAGFIATLLLNQNIWLQDDLISATPRAFVYPLFTAFLYYLLRRSLLPCLIAIALLGLFYPQALFISAGILILQLFSWKSGQLRLSRKRADFVFCGAGLAVALLVMLPYALESASSFGSVITAAEARKLPEFGDEGRARFFVRNPLEFWLTAERSGILPHTNRMLQPPHIITAFFLPILWRYPLRFPLLRQVSSKVKLLSQILLVSVGMFFAAHAVLFKLHHPSRYTQHSLRVVLALAAGIVLTVMLDAILHAYGERVKSRFDKRQLLALGSTVLLSGLLLLYPGFLKLINDSSFPRTLYVVGYDAQLYKFFSQQPKDILIASLAEEVNNLPTFSQRSILVGREYAIPYHVGYYRQFRQRVIDLIRAQYSPNLAEVQNFIQNYGIDFWLLDLKAFTPTYVAAKWFKTYQPIASDTIAKLEQGTTPALSTFVEPCSVFQVDELVVLKAECIAKASAD